jgi:arylsulfatase
MILSVSATLCVVMACIAAARQEDGGAAPAEMEFKVLSFTANAVYGTDHLIVRGDQFKIEHKADQTIRGQKVQVFKNLPRNDRYTVKIRNKRGAADVFVLQQPRPENGFELRVLIERRREMAAEAVAFDVYAFRAAEFERPYNIVLITIDTLRADRLGCYGYHRPTSPNLDRFTGQAVLFTNAFSTSSFTPPAHASLLTSRYVSDHGLLTWEKLPEEQLTLAEVLSDCGYRTAATICLTLLTRQNMGQGFEVGSEGIRDGREAVSDALAFLRMPGDGPFFLWLHVYDVHRPYGRAPNWVSCFSPSGRPGVGDSHRHYNLRPGQAEEQGLSAKDLQFIADRYDAGVAYVDSQLGPLLDELSIPRRLKDTMIVITSDHGESLLEYRKYLFSHDPFLYSVVTRVPLLIRYPEARGAGQRCDKLVSLIDVAPTVTDMIGLRAPDSFEGASLLPLLTGNPWPRTEIFMECWGWEKLRAIRSLERLLIHDLNSKKTMFFDLRSDRTEQNPSIAPRDSTASRLQRRLMEFIDAEGGDVEPAQLDAKTLKQLRTLGYID